MAYASSVRFSVAENVSYLEIFIAKIIYAESFLEAALPRPQESQPTELLLSDSGRVLTTCQYASNGDAGSRLALGSNGACWAEVLEDSFKSEEKACGP